MHFQLIIIFALSIKYIEMNIECSQIFRNNQKTLIFKLCRWKSGTGTHSDAAQACSRDPDGIDKLAKESFITGSVKNHLWSCRPMLTTIYAWILEENKMAMADTNGGKTQQMQNPSRINYFLCAKEQKTQLTNPSCSFSDVTITTNKVTITIATPAVFTTSTSTSMRTTSKLVSTTFTTTATTSTTARTTTTATTSTTARTTTTATTSTTARTTTTATTSTTARTTTTATTSTTARTTTTATTSTTARTTTTATIITTATTTKFTTQEATTRETYTRITSIDTIAITLGTIVTNTIWEQCEETIDVTPEIITVSTQTTKAPPKSDTTIGSSTIQLETTAKVTTAPEPNYTGTWLPWNTLECRVHRQRWVNGTLYSDTIFISSKFKYCDFLNKTYTENAKPYKEQETKEVNEINKNVSLEMKRLDEKYDVQDKAGTSFGWIAVIFISISVSIVVINDLFKLIYLLSKSARSRNRILSTSHNQRAFEKLNDEMHEMRRTVNQVIKFDQELHKKFLFSLRRSK